MCLRTGAEMPPSKKASFRFRFRCHHAAVFEPAEPYMHGVVAGRERFVQGGFRPLELGRSAAD